MSIRKIRRTLRIAMKNGEKEFVTQFKHDVENALDLVSARKRRVILALLNRA